MNRANKLTLINGMMMGYIREIKALTKTLDAIPMAVPASYNDIGVTQEIRDHVGWVRHVVDSQ